ncbi:MAG: YbaK/EbsC family protein [Gemmatimonadetes bacterium]|nr:YbaK/EbsC family protein [Gemmatimonadota bacterium]
MPAQQLKRFLDDNQVKYVTLSHSKAYTAQELATLAHVPGEEWAKTVVVKLDGKLAMAVIPAGQRVVLDLVKKVAGAKDVALATEHDFAASFPDCELGAMPPFGNLYGLDVYVADALADDEEIAFNAGSFSETVRMPYRDFERLVQPKAARISA